MTIALMLLAIMLAIGIIVAAYGYRYPDIDEVLAELAREEKNAAN